MGDNPGAFGKPSFYEPANNQARPFVPRLNNPAFTGTKPRGGGTSAAPDGQGGKSRQQLHSGGVRLDSTGAILLPADRDRPASSNGAKAAIAVINWRRASWTMAGMLRSPHLRLKLGELPARL